MNTPILLRFHITVLLVGFLGFHANAEDLVPHHFGHWRNYTAVDGLPGSHIWAITQARDGVLWIATDGDGVCRFDGASFETFTEQHGLGSNFVRDVFEDSRGDLWFATWGGGVTRFSGQLEETLTTADGLITDFVTAVGEDGRGDLWFGTNAGVSRYRDGRIVESFTLEDGVPQKLIHDIYADARGQVWFATEGGGILRYDGEKFHHIPLEAKYANWVYDIAAEKDGTLWFATWEGVYRYDGSAFLPPIVGSDDKPFRHVRAIAQDAESRFWFGTEDGRLGRFDGGVIHTVAPDVQLAENRITTALADDEGNFWFGTWGSGVFKLDPRVSVYLTGNSNISTAVEDRRGDVWFTRSDGGKLLRFDGRKLRQAQHIPTPSFHLIKASDGGLWCGGPGRLTRHNGETTQSIADVDWKNLQVEPICETETGRLWFELRAQSEAGVGDRIGLGWTDGARFHYPKMGERLGVDEPHTPSAVTSDDSGRLWFGTAGDGVFRFGANGFDQFTSKNGLGGDRISAIHRSRAGQLWFGIRGQDVPSPQGTRGGGLTMFDGATFHTFSKADGLANDSVASIFEAKDGAMWFGTWHGGVSRYFDGRFQTFNTGDGLAGNSVIGILVDRDGHLWFGTINAGITKYDGENFQSITTADGLNSNTAVPLCADRSGNIWISHEITSGLTKYTRPKSVKPRVKLTQVVADKPYDAHKPLKIRTDVTQVVFHFQGLSHRTPFENIRYTYKLDGYDAAWSPAVLSRSATYRRLKPGRYTFRVKSLDRDLNHSTPATVTFSAVLPFWQTVAFLIPTIGGGLALIVALVAVSFGYIRRRRQVNAYQRAATVELQQAREIQQSLLPKALPHAAGFELAGLCEPASVVGGDYYTYFWRDNAKTQLGVVLMDVVGHGMKAASMAFLANGMLQSEVRAGQPPERLITNMHESLRDVLPRNAFVAMAFMQIDLKTKTLTDFSAAVPKPILVRDGQFAEIDVPGQLPLGSPLPRQYTGHTVPLKSGDVLLCFSDGLTEAKNSDGEMYEEVRLKERLADLCRSPKTAQAWLDGIRADVEAFIAPRHLDDDLTLVVVRLT